MVQVITAMGVEEAVVRKSRALLMHRPESSILKLESSRLLPESSGLRVFDSKASCKEV